MFKNFLTLGGGETVSRTFQVIAILLLARRVGLQALGYYGLASAVTAYLVLLVQQGFDTTAIRSVAQRRGDVVLTVERIVGVRLVAATALTIAVIAYVALFSPGDPTAWLILIFCISHFSAALSVRWALLAEGGTQTIAVATIVSNVIFLASVLLVSRADRIGWAVAGQGFGELVGSALMWFQLTRRARDLRPRLDWRYTRDLVVESWPLSLSLVLGTMMFNFDIVALRALGRASEIGAYVAVYRCITIFNPALSALQMSIYPAFSRAWPRFAAVRAGAVATAAGAAIVLAVAASLMAWQGALILRLLYGREYLIGLGYLRVLVWVLPLQGIRSVARQVIYAWHGQRDDLRNLSLAVATNITIDGIAIPGFGALGCAWSSWCTELVFTLACLWSAFRAVRSTEASAGANYALQ